MVKERWSTDPNGEVWARDEEKFGQKMLEKMGWSQGKGLGADEAGSTSHIKVKKRATNLGLGADSNTPDRWTEHISEFDDILSKLNTNKSISAPNSNQASAANSESEHHDNQTPESGKRKKRKKSKDLYTKFKKHKNLGSLSTQDMTHIFGEATDKQMPRADEDSKSKKSEYTGDLSGVKTITSSMSLAEYFNSKKVRSTTAKTAEDQSTADSSFKFGFKTTADDEEQKPECDNLKPKTKKQRTKRTKTQ